MVSTTRPMSCLTLRSRSGVPIVPRKYLETTMLVACWDHDFGISTSRCSNTMFPFSLPMTAERTSHSTSSNGSSPSRVKNRGYSIPESPPGSIPGTVVDTGADGRAVDCVLVDSTCGAAPLCIIPSEREPLTSPWPGPKSATINGWACRTWRGKKRHTEQPLKGLHYEGESPLAAPCESWEGLARFICAGGQYGPCLQRCQGSIYKILCLQNRAGARY